jgi:hypothetical protein
MRWRRHAGWRDSPPLALGEPRPRLPWITLMWRNLAATPERVLAVTVHHTHLPPSLASGRAAAQTSRLYGVTNEARPMSVMESAPASNARDQREDLRCGVCAAHRGDDEPLGQRPREPTAVGQRHDRAARRPSPRSRLALSRAATPCLRSTLTAGQSSQRGASPPSSLLPAEVVAEPGSTSRRARSTVRPRRPRDGLVVIGR